MKTKNYKVMKVFDCWDMPEEPRKALFECWDDKGNDTFVEWNLEEFPEGPIGEWFLANGAEAGDTVLVSYRW